MRIAVRFILLVAVLLFDGSCSGSVGDMGATNGKLIKFEFSLSDGFFVTSVAWSPDGRYIASASTHSPLLHVWDVKRQSLFKEYNLALSAPYYHTLAWSPDGQYLAACSAGTVKVFHMGGDVEKQPTEVAAHGCVAAAFSTDGKELAVLTHQLQVFSTVDWHIVKKSDLGTQKRHAYLLNALQYVPGTHDIVVGGGGFEKVVLPGKTQFSVNGLLLFIAAEDAVPSRLISVYPNGHGGGADVKSLAVSPDRSTVATGVTTGEGGADSGVVTKSVHLLRLADGSLIGAPLDGLKFGPGCVAFTPDGRYLVTGHRDDVSRGIHLLDAHTAAIVDEAKAITRVNDVSTGPDLRFAVATNSKVMIWKIIR